MNAPGLIDRFDRRIEYVRLSVTDRCDLRCFYCMPKGHREFETPAHWLRFDEVERILKIFAGLGVTRIRITGGEPLVRSELPNLIQRIATIPGFHDLSLSTNATRLSKLAAPLWRAGVRRLNISLDTLREERYRRITRGKLGKVLHGLAEAKTVGFHPIKINMVVMKGVNDDEVSEMVAFCLHHGYTLRFIETMPVGESGRGASARYYRNLQDIKAELERDYTLIPGCLPGGGPARYFQVAGTAMSIGFITPLSRHFCATCNRVRLAVDGTLYTCLGQDHAVALRPLLRDGASNTTLIQTILTAIDNKPERHEFNEHPERIVRFMSSTGG